MPSTQVIDEVPLLDLQAQYDGIRDEVEDAVNKVLESQYFIMGPEVSSFEEQVAEYCNTDFAISCASGSDALLLSLMALDIAPGDAVITSSFTFFATGGAVARLGATPVFLDINSATFNIAPNQLETFLTGCHPLNKKLSVDADDVKAVIPVHLYGQMANMEPIMQLADEYDFSVIEDAAQSIGSEYKSKRAGSIGHFGCFSFFPSKNLGGYGDGGLVTTNDAEMAKKLQVLRLHGAKPKYHHSVVGINSRLDAIQAAVLKVKLQYLDQWSEERREKAQIYNKLFRETGLTANNISHKYGEQKVEGIKVFLPEEIQGAPNAGGRHIYHQYVIRTNKRSQIIEALAEGNIGHSIYYPVPLHEQECFSYLGYEPEDNPISHHFSRTTLALPIYPELTLAQQQYIVQAIKGA